MGNIFKRLTINENENEIRYDLLSNYQKLNLIELYQGKIILVPKQIIKTQDETAILNKFRMRGGNISIIE